MELAKSWEDIRNLLVKYAIREKKVIYERIVLHTQEMIQQEKQIYNKMGEYIGEDK